MGGKALAPSGEAIQKLAAARLTPDVMSVPTLITARADADIAHLLTSDIDPRDRRVLTGERAAEGFFRIRSRLDSATARTNGRILDTANAHDHRCVSAANSFSLPRYELSLVFSGSQRTALPWSRLALASRAAPAARNPNTGSSTTGRRVRTA